MLASGDVAATIGPILGLGLFVDSAFDAVEHVAGAFEYQLEATIGRPMAVDVPVAMLTVVTLLLVVGRLPFRHPVLGFAPPLFGGCLGDGFDQFFVAGGGAV